MPAAISESSEKVLDLEQAWRAAIQHSLEHARDDLRIAETAEVVFVRHRLPSTGVEFLDALEADARAQQFVTARVPVFAGKAFDHFEGLVRSVGRSVRVPTDGDSPEGLSALLTEFARRERRAALAVFDRRAHVSHANGDLIALARAYLDAKRQPARELARIDAWLSGTDTTRADTSPIALGTLEPRTAKRAFCEISILVRVLGWNGLLVIFEDADVVAKLPPGRRDAAYTVLRELIDNTDTARGMTSTQIVVAGQPALFTGKRSIESLAPLASRVNVSWSDRAELPPPHRPLIDLDPPAHWVPRDSRTRKHVAVTDAVADLRTMIRAAHGVPPIDASASLTVGYEKVDATIGSLFHHSAHEGSVFALLVGAYGAGKTHLLGHLANRALADRRPVLRLSLERLDTDLGAPQRHLRRMLEHGTLPLPHLPTPLERLTAWTRSPLHTKRMLAFLEELANSGGDSAPAAKRILRTAKGDRAALVLERFLVGHDLEAKAASRSSRLDSYARTLIWFALLERLEGCAGPVLVIDEGENLFRGGTTRAERRTALRSLAFYCGGTLPRACVVLAITPDALVRLKQEAPELLGEIAAHRGTLPWEDAAMFERRLARTRATQVPALPSELRTVLAFRVRSMCERVRGKIEDHQFASFVERLVADDVSARETVRRVVDRLEGIAARRGT